MKDTEIDCTPLFAALGFDPWNCYNSAANLGQDAMKLTWQASKSFVSSLTLTEGQKEAFRAFVRSSGGWTRDEIEAWSDAELTTLCIQWIAGDIRESFGDGLPDDPAEWDWAEYTEMVESGSAPSRLYLKDGKLFWSCEQ